MRPVGSAPPSRLFPNQTIDFAQKTISAPCECLILRPPITPIIEPRNRNVSDGQLKFRTLPVHTEIDDAITIAPQPASIAVSAEA
jgi:hypothetical protein